MSRRNKKSRLWQQITQYTQHPLLKHFFSVLLFLALLAMYLFFPKAPPEIRELLLLAVVVMAVHIVDRLLIYRTISKVIDDTAEKMAGHLSDLANSTHAVGLVKIYPDRSKAVQDVISSLETAKDRIYLLGIALTNPLSLKQLIPLLEESKAKDIRLLLLDPLRSPAVFRAFLESDLETIEKVLFESTKANGDMQHLFSMQLYRDCDYTFDVLNETKSLKDRVKYYGHNPNCWMVIADNIAYFEPYTFGQPAKENPNDRRFGPYMPVFRFESNSDSATFEVLCRHFTKLWETTDCGYIHYYDRWRLRQESTKKAINHRHAWFTYVYKALLFAASNKEEQRCKPRRPCEHNLTVHLSWKESSNDGYETLVTADATILESSSGGLGLELAPQQKLPPLHQHVELSANARPQDEVAQFMLQRYIDKSFEVKEIKDRRISLQLIEQANASRAASQAI